MAEWRPKKAYEPRTGPTMPPKANPPVGLRGIRPAAVGAPEVDVNSVLPGIGVSITRPSSAGFVIDASGVVLSVAGTLHRIVIGGTPSHPTIDIASDYVGQTSITTLGTITTGVWQGTSIDIAFTDAKVKSIIAGTAIGVSSATGNVTVTNDGVTSLIAGPGITISSAVGDVTVTADGTVGLSPFLLMGA